MKGLPWAYFVAAQALTAVCMLLGFVVLLLPCALEAWETSPYLSINPAHKGRIDRWSWGWLNPIWGNPEDGVSGQKALVWVNGVTQRPYWPGCPSPRLRAYVWSAWRNSCDQLKYTLAVTRFGTPSVVIAGRRVGWSVENGRPVLVS